MSWNFTFEGILRSMDGLLVGDRPPSRAVSMDDNDLTENQITLRALIMYAPILTPTLIVTFTKFWQFNKDYSFSVRYGTLALILPIIILTFLIHEVIHGLFYPKSAKKMIWFRHDGGINFSFIIYCSAPLSKRKTLFLGMTPVIVLGFIPFILWIGGIFDFNKLFSLMLGIVIALQIAGGANDYYNCLDIYKRVPKGAVIMNYGDRSYWYSVETE